MAKYRRVAVDGIDGAGKTTTVNELHGRLHRRGLRVVRADRSGANSSTTIAVLTDVIKASDGRLAPLTAEADGLLRLARASERLALRSDTHPDVTLFDRWIVTDLALLSEPVFTILRPAIVNLIERTPDTLTILLDAPFEITWARVLQRPASERSSKELLGREHNLAVHARTGLGVERFLKCGGSLERIDSTQPLDAVVDQIMNSFC